MSPRRATGSFAVAAALLGGLVLPAVGEPAHETAPPARSPHDAAPGLPHDPAPGLPQEPARPFAWRTTYGEALGAALRRRTPLLLYFPPIDLAAEPPVVRAIPRALGVPPLVEGARVGADEILELKDRFGVKELPAVLFLDRRENAVYRWEGRIPANLGALVETLVRRLEKRDAEDRKVAADGAAMAAGGDIRDAYRKVAPLLESEHTAPEALAEAKGIEAKYLVVGRRRMLEALASEGLIPDSVLAKNLAALRGDETHPGMRAEILREIDRLRERKAGGH